MATDLVEIDVDDPQPEALERAAATIRRGKGVAIPTDALYTLVADPFMPAVKVLIAHQRPVVLGRVAGNDYVVVSGIKAGEKLITGGLQKIGDGAPVQELPSRGAQPPASGGPPPPKTGSGEAGGRGRG